MTEDIQYPKSGAKDEKGRPVLLRYKFGFDPRRETFIFAMAGIPHALMTLEDAGVLEGEEMIRVGQVLNVMVLQAIEDRDPAAYFEWRQQQNRRKSKRKAEGKDEADDDTTDSYVLFSGLEPWVGTPERICHWFRVHNSERELEEKEKGGPEPLPTHIHGDGSCEMEDDGEGGEFCSLQSREEEEKHRAVLKKEREAKEDPVHIADCIATLERFGLIVPVGADYKPEYPPYPNENQDTLLETQSSKSPVTLRNVDVKKREEKDNANVNVREVEGKNTLGRRTAILRNRTPTLLNQETIEKLQEGGIDPDHIRYLGCLSGCAEALKRSTNPAKAAKTMIARDSFPDRFGAWIKNHPAD